MRIMRLSFCSQSSAATFQIIRLNFVFLVMCVLIPLVVFFFRLHADSVQLARFLKEWATSHHFGWAIPMFLFYERPGMKAVRENDSVNLMISACCDFLISHVLFGLYFVRVKLSFCYF